MNVEPGQIQGREGPSRIDPRGKGGDELEQSHQAPPYQKFQKI